MTISGSEVCSHKLRFSGLTDTKSAAIKNCLNNTKPACAAGYSERFREQASRAGISTTISKTTLVQKPMKYLLTLIAALVIASQTHAGDMKVEAAIAKDKDTRPATTFVADVPNALCIF
jgi:hypothetical protein